jgi:hypothetical protein
VGAIVALLYIKTQQFICSIPILDQTMIMFLCDHGPTM